MRNNETQSNQQDQENKRYILIERDDACIDAYIPCLFDGVARFCACMHASLCSHIHKLAQERC